MWKKSIRLRKEYLYKKENEEKERKEYLKKLEMKEAIDNNKKISTEVHLEKDEIKKKLALSDSYHMCNLIST